MSGGEKKIGCGQSNHQRLHREEGTQLVPFFSLHLTITHKIFIVAMR
jgi:hypothetical protein